LIISVVTRISSRVISGTTSIQQLTSRSQCPSSLDVVAWYVTLINPGSAGCGSLLRSARQQLHAQIAEALEAHSLEILDSQPELLAQQYAEAGLVEKSVAYWGKAGDWLAARGAGHSVSVSLEHFVIGLLNGMSIATIREFWGADGHNISRDAGFFWIDNYCRSHPTDLIFATAIAFFKQRTSCEVFPCLPQGSSR
jgi:hypothetical protein